MSTSSLCCGQGGLCRSLLLTFFFFFFFYIGIYASFLTWALLQERISATGYGPELEIYRGSLVINTIQSLLAMLVGYVYMTFKTKSSSKQTHSNLAVFTSNRALLAELVLVALSQSLASPFGYAALGYVNYLTLLLAKSCKLVPVMFIHLTVYRRSFPLYKYLVVFAITAGVFMFTYYKAANGSSASHAAKATTAAAAGSWIGLGLLGVNLLLDGVTNSTQDHIFHKHKQMTGPHMMFGLNGVATLLTAAYLAVSAAAVHSGAHEGGAAGILGSLFSDQVHTTLDFVARNGPRVLVDTALFGLCGALGQVFIFHTLERYGSLILVTVTVTRKMVSMLLSVVWFNHRLTAGQWVGVAAVFGGIGAEAAFKYWQTKQKQLKKE